MSNPLDDPIIKENLEKISKVMEKLEINHLSEIMKTQLSDGIELTETGTFMSHMTSSSFKLSKTDAMELAKEFKFE